VLVGAFMLFGSLAAAFAHDSRSADGDCPAIALRYEPADGGALVIRACGVISPVFSVALRYDVHVRLTVIPFGANVENKSPIWK